MLLQYNLSKCLISAWHTIKYIIKYSKWFAGGGGGSLGTPGGGRTMRDYEESFKEMRKENFNLKLRIFFLEERMGIGKKLPRDELAANNLELKVRESNREN